MARLIDADALNADFIQKHTANADVYLTVRKIIGNAPTVDAVHRETLAQVMWERDVAMKQLEEHGIPFGCKADVQAVVHGEWMHSTTWKYDYLCSVCGEFAVEGAYENFDSLTAYCPHCGAKMDGKVSE